VLTRPLILAVILYFHQSGTFFTYLHLACNEHRQTRTLRRRNKTRQGGGKEPSMLPCIKEYQLPVVHALAGSANMQYSS
jgi:hypothetical protein